MHCMAKALLHSLLQLPKSTCGMPSKECHPQSGAQHPSLHAGVPRGGAERDADARPLT